MTSLGYLLTILGYMRKDCWTQGQPSNSGQSARHRRGIGPGSDLQTHQPSDEFSQSRFPTSSPLLHHPVPCRPTLPQLLRSRSAESETAASNVAQVGTRKPETPFSQRAENEVWRTFVGGPPGVLSSKDLLPQDGCLSEPLVSPGVSQLGPPVPAAGPEERQCASSSSLAVSLENSHGVKEPVIQTLPDILSPGHIVSGLFTGGSSHGNESSVSSCADHRTSGETLFDICSDASSSQDAAAALEECNPTSLGPNVPSSDRNMTSANDQARETTQKPTQEADGMSVLALPSSIDSLSEDVPDISRNSPLVRGKEMGAEGSIDGGESKNHLKKCQQDLAEAGIAIEQCSSSDENDLWRKFVFGESSDGFEKGLEDARRQTARNLRPSTTTTNSSVNSVDLQQSCLGEKGSGTEERSPALSEESQLESNSVADDFDKSSTCMTTNVSASHIGTARNSSPDPLAEEFFKYSDPLARTDQATHGSSSSVSTVPVHRAGDSTHCSDVWSLTTRGKHHASKPARPQPAKERPRPKSNVFVQPKPFLGRKTSHLDEQRQIALSTPQVRGKHPTSRHQKRRRDGRTAIRKLPNFNGDPIEEFEDSLSRGTKEHSLFGSLEVEIDS